MAARPIPRLTPEEYLIAERAADCKSEYVNGEVFAMSGGSVAHAMIINEIARDLGNALEDRNCRVTSNDVRLQVSPEGAYLYPDILVFCERLLTDPADIISNPILIVEVLSNSTERWDRGGKFIQYQRVSSLREYLLVSQDERRMEWFTRGGDGGWVYREVSGPGAVCKLELLGVTLSLDRIYRNLLLNP